MAAGTRNLGIVMWWWEVEAAESSPQGCKIIPVPAILPLKPAEIAASETDNIWGFKKKKKK